MWQRWLVEIAAACEDRDKHHVQGLKPGRRVCLQRVSFDERGWMNVRRVPACSHLVQPPSWTRVVHFVTIGPGLELSCRKCP